MRRAVIAVVTACLLVTACATSRDAATPAAVQVPTVQASLTRDGDVWTLDYEFDRDAPAWAFNRSALIMDSREAWRPRDWRVETPGVAIERIGSWDVLRSTDGGPVPRKVRLSVTPKSETLEADYSILTFTDGSVAFPASQFEVFPLPSLEAAQRELTDDEMTASERLTFRDLNGQVLFQGQRWDSVNTDNGESYVLFGQAQVHEGERLVTVVDPELPTWISAAIEGTAPRIADYYARRLGPGETERPMVMAAWKGSTEGIVSMGGSVMPGTIVMVFEGKRLLEPSDDFMSMIGWFTGHEEAHFWLGQTVAYESDRDAWITEGGADMMAIRALTALDPSYHQNAKLQEEVDDCIRLADDSINTVAERGEHRARYACGALFAMAAEGVQSRKDGGDWFDFLKGLIDANREDRIITADEWLDHLDAAGGSPALRAGIEALLTNGAADPKAAVANILSEGGVAHRIEGERVLLE